jgi:hypothetical protein
MNVSDAIKQFEKGPGPLVPVEGTIYIRDDFVGEEFVVLLQINPNEFKAFPIENNYDGWNLICNRCTDTVYHKSEALPPSWRLVARLGQLRLA